MTRLAILATAALGLAATGAVVAQQTLPKGDAAAGRQVAERWCANCHVVGGVQERASADAPAFQTIADNPAWTAEKLLTFLEAPALAGQHVRMPDLQLSREQAGDVTAYVLSLRK